MLSTIFRIVLLDLLISLIAYPNNKLALSLVILNISFKQAIVNSSSNNKTFNPF